MEGVPPVSARAGGLEAQLRTAREQISRQGATIAALQAELARYESTGGPAMTRAGAAHIDADSPAGHALGKLMRTFGAKIAVVSAPQCGPGPTDGEFKIPVMVGLERIASYIFPEFITAYDFKGSSSAGDCASVLPDKEMLPENWADSTQIAATQWCRYWMGRVRGTLSALLLSACATPNAIVLKGVMGAADDPSTRAAFGSSCRVIIAVSISGGPITQTEFGLLPSVIAGLVSDLTTGDLAIQGVRVLWLHFDRVEDLLKALQGYGGIDVSNAVDSNRFDKPGRWSDGPYNEDYDVLRGVPGDTPDERRAYLMQERRPSADALGVKLHNAVQAGCTRRVSQLLEQGANPDRGKKAIRPLRTATMWANPAIVRLLLEAGADPNFKDTKDHLTHLEFAKTRKWPNLARDAAGEVQARIDATTQLLVAAQSGRVPR